MPDALFPAPIPPLPLAYRVAQLSAAQYDVYRLFTLYGPADDAALAHRARMHGLLRATPGTLHAVRAGLVRLGLLVELPSVGPLHPGEHRPLRWTADLTPPSPTPSAPNSPA